MLSPEDHIVGFYSVDHLSCATEDAGWPAWRTGKAEQEWWQGFDRNPHLMPWGRWKADICLLWWELLFYRSSRALESPNQFYKQNKETTLSICVASGGRCSQACSLEWCECHQHMALVSLGLSYQSVDCLPSSLSFSTSSLSGHLQCKEDTLWHCPPLQGLRTQLYVDLDLASWICLEVLGLRDVAYRSFPFPLPAPPPQLTRPMCHPLVSLLGLCTYVSMVCLMGQGRTLSG